MANQQKERAQQNRKRRKEQLNLKKGNKRACTVEKTTKVKSILKQKRNPKRTRIGNEDANQEKSSQAPSEIEKMGGTESNIWKFGKPKYRCEHYNALIWFEDRPRPKLATKRPAFGMCCK